MADNSLKSPLNRSLPQAIQNKILDAIQLQGKALPAHVVSKSGAMITVAFDVHSTYTLPQVTIPLFGPEYIRYPLQSGDRGFVLPMDARTGYSSGQGGGIPDLSQPANLAALVFLPIGNTQWSSVDPNAVVVRGPNGVVLEDETNACTFVLTPTSVTCIAPNQIKLQSGATTMTITPTGWSITGSNGSLSDGSHTTSVTLMNSTWAALLSWLSTHQHSDPQGGNTGAPTTSPPSGNIAP
ncbi:hypothetical protein [Burkholderia ubonensis]|uniref:hypothetical protein n=1 Tax=Burkholderia ubonensis TaxID=101571 RepID=UPI0009B34F77|nr:hypothetical protein [Burkholderia ubonensis]